MKVMERLPLAHLRPLFDPSQDKLQFTYQTHVDVDDVIIFPLRKAHFAMHRHNTTVRITLCHFLNAFNTIQPRPLKVELEDMQVDLL